MALRYGGISATSAGFVGNGADKVTRIRFMLPSGTNVAPR